MLQVHFYAKALEHSIANYEATFAERVARVERAWDAAEEGRALVKQKEA